MKRRTQLAATGAVAAAIVLASGSLALASSDDGADPNESETAISGLALEKASESALAHTGEGTVTGTEVNDEESYYEVEVTLDNGSQVDVQLDEQFQVVEATPDSSTDE
ncbi:hypothetical protein E3O42_11040 [Cryobacterium adonitolivorans]|uniref:Uncharacterized protein n=1 Tax=Cryobacterium adonitolivorans TaxID=1259189 RepID=A0A4R8W213_9MICO|nr:PepSY domain-containing protein [Cryobacterium adonitolivorans]TFC01010.1 hypothetical protein E3O42_11040 [Cryobacterium adonitolivorans]